MQQIFFEFCFRKQFSIRIIWNVCKKNVIKIGAKKKRSFLHFSPEFRLVLNISEKSHYNPALVWINVIPVRFVCVCVCMCVCVLRFCNLVLNFRQSGRSIDVWKTAIPGRREIPAIHGKSLCHSWSLASKNASKIHVFFLNSQTQTFYWCSRKIQTYKVTHYV